METRKETEARRVKRQLKQTAAERYADHQNDIGAMIDLIGEELRVHAENAAKEPRNWCMVGDLDHVRESLKDVRGLVWRLPEPHEPSAEKPRERIALNPERPYVADLDSLPLPARHLLPNHAYRMPFFGRHPFATVIPSRGRWVTKWPCFNRPASSPPSNSVICPCGSIVAAR